MKDEGICKLTRRSKTYPALLKEINDPPKELYVRGNVEVLSHEYLLAVVGSRKAKPYGKQAMNLLLPPVIRAGAVIVSGMAYGIDALSHQAALEEGSPTIAVLGGSVDDASLYPRDHAALAKKILDAGGCLVSEYPPGTKAARHQFPERNRIIAGMCQAIIVVQAATKSGSLITARLALEYNRELLAVPGEITNPYSQGTNYLIHEGAIPAISPQDLLDVLKLEPLPESTLREAHLNDEQRTLLEHVSESPRHVDEISGLVKLPPHQVSALLLELELSGCVVHIGGMKYVRKAS